MPKKFFELNALFIAIVAGSAFMIINNVVCISKMVAYEPMLTLRSVIGILFGLFFLTYISFFAGMLRIIIVNESE